MKEMRFLTYLKTGARGHSIMFSLVVWLAAGWAMLWAIWSVVEVKVKGLREVKLGVVKVID